MKKTLILSCALALAGMSSAAFAGQGYIRGEIGRSNIDVTAPGFSESGDDTSAVFGGGYWFNPNFAIEGHLGTLSNTALDDGTDADLVTLGAGIAAKKNFGPDNSGFFIGGRAGIARMTAQIRDGLNVEEDESSVKPYFGVNAGYDFNPNFGLSLNFDRRTGEFNGVDFDVDSLMLGGEYRF